VIYRATRRSTQRVLSSLTYPVACL